MITETIMGKNSHRCCGVGWSEERHSEEVRLPRVTNQVSHGDLPLTPPKAAEGTGDEVEELEMMRCQSGTVGSTSCERVSVVRKG